MSRITTRDQKALNRLVLDCNIYSLSEKEALEYIKQRLGKEISGRTYRRYKENLHNGNITQSWLNYYTKIGFAVEHQELIHTAKSIFEDTLETLQREEQKPEEQRNENLLLKLKQEAREEITLISELALGTPIISQIKKKMNDLESELKERRNYST